MIRYSYDPDNRLIAVESKEGGRIEFAYDAFGRRIAKETKDGSVGFLWDGDVLLAEERGARSYEYIFEPGSFAPLCRFDEGGFETYHNDHLGTPLELTDRRGQVVWSARYDVYGRVNQLQADQAENQIRFQGQYEDYEVGLYYNRFRYYDPESGRYITQDPIRVAGGLNLYAYAHNPITWVDPLGLAECSEGGEAGRRIITVDLLHGTKHPPSAFRRWMFWRRINVSAGSGQLGPGFYVTQDRHVAVWFARGWPDRRGGASGARILHLQIPKSDFDRLRVIELADSSDEYIRLTDAWVKGKGVPADLRYLIKDFDAIKAPVFFGSGQGEQFKFNPRAQSFVNRYPFSFEELK